MGREISPSQSSVYLGRWIWRVHSGSHGATILKCISYQFPVCRLVFSLALKLSDILMQLWFGVIWEAINCFTWKTIFMSSNRTPVKIPILEFLYWISLSCTSLWVFGTKVWHYYYQFQTSRLDGLSGSSTKKAEQIKLVPLCILNVSSWKVSSCSNERNWSVYFCQTLSKRIMKWACRPLLRLTEHMTLLKVHRKRVINGMVQSLQHRLYVQRLSPGLLSPTKIMASLPQKD